MRPFRNENLMYLYFITNAWKLVRMKDSGRETQKKIWVQKELIKQNTER
jgi:hypothetical protein